MAAESCVIELESKYLMDEETCLSDDSEVSVANMTRTSDNETFSTVANDEKSCLNNDSMENEIVSDDEYNYSDDSVCSEDPYEDSEITNVTPRSTLSADTPLNRTFNEKYSIARSNENNRDHESSYPRQYSDNIRDNIRRMCSSVNDNRCISRNVANIDSMNSRAGRRNMSFTNAEMRRIEAENQYLLDKIMSHQKPQNKPMRTQSAQPRLSSSAINRRKMQKRIEEENMMLVRRIQKAKSCAVSSNVAPGYRLTSL